MTLFGLHLVKREHSQKVAKHDEYEGKRFDTLALTTRGLPAIIEYKKKKDKNVLRQLIEYVDRIVRYPADFELLVAKSPGLPSIRSGKIRIICVAESFENPDVTYARNCKHKIELVSYRYFNNALLFEWVYGKPPRFWPPESNGDNSAVPDAPSLEQILKIFHRTVKSIGPGITHYKTKTYEGYEKDGKSFLTFYVYRKNKRIKVWLPLDPGQEKMGGKNLRDMRGKGRKGAGPLEILIDNAEIINKYEYLLRKSYDRLGDSNRSKHQKPKPFEALSKNQSNMAKAVNNSDNVRRKLFQHLCASIIKLAPKRIECVETKYYYAFRKDGKNFMFVRAFPQLNTVRFSFNLDVSKVALEGIVIKDGCWANNNRFQIDLATEDHLKMVKPLIKKAFEEA